MGIKGRSIKLKNGKQVFLSYEGRPSDQKRLLVINSDSKGPELRCWLDDSVLNALCLLNSRNKELSSNG